MITLIVALGVVPLRRASLHPPRFFFLFRIHVPDINIYQYAWSSSSAGTSSSGSGSFSLDFVDLVGFLEGCRNDLLSDSYKSKGRSTEFVSEVLNTLVLQVVIVELPWEDNVNEPLIFERSEEHPNLKILDLGLSVGWELEVLGSFLPIWYLLDNDDSLVE